MSDALPDPPALDPGALSAADFSRSRKGFEPTEVNSLLGRAADALRVWEARDHQLSAEVEALRARLDAAEHLDEAKVTELLGAETARIVTAARTASTEIRERAEADAVELRRSTEAEVAETSTRLMAEATADREAATAQLAEAETTVAGRLQEATERAEATTTAAQAEADQLLADARARHDELIASASTVYDERSREAEEAAAGIRQAASAERAEAAADAERIRSTASRDGEEELERAREGARAMLEETRTLRHRMLSDLAERRRTVRQQTEAARAAREGIVAAIRTAAVRLDDTLGELDDQEVAVRQSAEVAAAAVPDDVAEVAATLEAELDGAPGTASAAPDTTTTDQGAPGPADGAEVETDALDSTDDTAEVDQAVELIDAEADPADEVGGDAADTIEVDDTAEDTADDDTMASVHDLFERLRSGTDEAGDAGAEGAASLDGDGGHLVADATERSAPIDLTTVPSAPAGAELAEAGGGASSAADPAAGAVATAVADPAQDATRLLDRRDELLAPAEQLMARNLKRLVGDEQNEVLDRARRIRRGRAELDDLLAEDATERFTVALAEPYRLAAAAGAAMWCELTDSAEPDLLASPAAEELTASLSARVAEVLELRRVHLRTAIDELDESGEDLGVLVEHLRSAYRELRATSVPEQAADLAAGGFNVGTSLAAPDGARWRWVVDNGGLPCADAEDNALAGALECGAEFPTGDARPPAHPGCRCILAPAVPGN